MKTRWGKALDENNVLPEYPRPQMRRESYIPLNGIWRYAITLTHDAPEKPDGNIIVPFSPECELSGVSRALKPEETLWYMREFTMPENWQQGRALIHFGAVDQTAEVYLNGHELGRHTGGFTAFSFDMTSCLKQKNSIAVRVTDSTDTSYHSRGKQKTKRGGIWYTPQSGIWQSVWAELVPDKYIESIDIMPCFDESAVEISVWTNSIEPLPCVIRTGDIVAHGVTGAPVRMSIEGFTPWSPETPKLYDLEISAGDDRVSSYFAMRKFSVSNDEKGVPRLFLNNAPYYNNGVLDQGYWPDGLLTAPSDEAMINDIRTMKRMGFNTLRKHIKIEPMRWYYHCDRLGMLVWQDMPNGGSSYNPLTVGAPVLTGKNMTDTSEHYSHFGRSDEKGRSQYIRELNEMIEQLHNCPCVSLWVPFNEGWGQFDAARIREYILSLDPTRTVDHASGWHDQYVGNVQSLHVYFKPYKFTSDRLGRAVLLSEFGGYNRRIEGHCFSRKDFGYRRFKSDNELLSAFGKLYETEIIPAKQDGLAASIYTQLSDVEDELNGLMTYDREIVKLPEDEVAKIMENLK